MPLQVAHSAGAPPCGRCACTFRHMPYGCPQQIY
jgi:hypothetical protein